MINLIHTNYMTVEVNELWQPITIVIMMLTGFIKLRTDITKIEVSMQNNTKKLNEQDNDLKEHIRANEKEFKDFYKEHKVDHEKVLMKIDELKDLIIDKLNK